MAKVIVFGGSGFLGSYVCDELFKRGFQVHIADINTSDYLKSGMVFHNIDLEDSESIEKLFADSSFEYVFNFAGLADINIAFNEPVLAIQQNVIGNLNLLNVVVKHSVKRYIYASSAYANSSKGSFYGISKLCSEKIIEEYSSRYQMDFTIVRYGSLYGDRANHHNGVYRMLHAALSNGKIKHIGNGSEVREYIHAADAARLSVDVMSQEKYKNRHLILTGVERLEQKDLLRMIQEIMDNKIEIEYSNESHQGHYEVTPYSFRPVTGLKLAANPYIDMGQGLLDCLHVIHKDIQNQDSNTKVMTSSL